jgi:hypothetical protein
MFVRMSSLAAIATSLGLALVVPACDGCGGGPPDVDEPEPEVVDVNDIDGDGVPNALDEDIDGDGQTNIQDDDVDGDGIPNADEVADGTNPFGDGDDQEGAQGDIDGDGIPNNVDNDDDGNQIPDGVQGDGTCDGGQTTVDDENADCDGFCLDLETGFLACDDGAPPGTGVPDSDGDGIPDPLDPDDDGDGIPDADDDNGGGVTPEDPVDPEDPTDPQCSETTFSAGDDILQPRILLVIDKSGSMNADDTGGQRKWDAARNALSGVVNNLEEQIEFGLMLYPNGDANNDVCREGNLREDVQPTNADDIIDELNNTEPGGGTPTAATLGQARQALDALGAEGGARAVILATDGGPNCNESLNGDTCRCVSQNPQDCIDFPGNCLDDSNTLGAAAALNAAGYPVFVAGIDGSEAFSDVLNALATAGGTAQAGATAFYGVDDQGQLEDAIEDIAVRVGICRFDLPANFAASDATVTVNGQDIARDTSRINGWDQVDPNTIELFGVPCSDAVNGGAGATIVVIRVCVG